MPVITKRDVNGPRNFLKHPVVSMDLSATLELDDEMNASMLWVACHDCAMLCKEAQPPEAQAFTMWFIATRFPDGSKDPDYAAGADEILGRIHSAYPRLRAAPPDEQESIGKAMLPAVRKVAARLAANKAPGALERFGRRRRLRGMACSSSVARAHGGGLRAVPRAHGGCAL